MGLFIVFLAFLITAAKAKSEAGPTAESAMLAEQKIAQAFRENDADGIVQLLSNDYAVINTAGGIGEEKSLFSDGMKSGFLTRKSFDFSEARVRLLREYCACDYKAQNIRRTPGKPFDVTEPRPMCCFGRTGFGSPF